MPHTCIIHHSLFTIHYSLKIRRLFGLIDNPLSEKSLDFAAKVIKFCIKVNADTKENVITKQLIRSSTSIGANISEANCGVSKADFIAKMQISLKEAAESEYWLRLLYKAEYVKKVMCQSLLICALYWRKCLLQH